MSDDILAILIFVAILAGVIWFFRFGKRVRHSYYAKTENDSYRGRVFGRSLVTTIFLGWGGIGTEGFGLPAPVLPGLIFGAFHDLTAPSYMGSLFLMNVVAFIACWCFALVYFAIKERAAK